MFSSLRQRFDPWDLSVKWLNLHKVPGPSHDPGLVIVQIDGFSREELESALERNEMPFLKKLLNREHYRLHAFYSGLPSTTPAVQGELFYGVRQAVPSFFFYDRQAHKVFRMFDGDAVREMESRLAGQGQALLAGGSSYSNIYAGGAKETHFCAGSLGWGHVWKDVNIFNFVLLFLTHFAAVLRMAILFLWETALAAADCVHGVLKKEDLIIELKFVYLRVFLGLLLRELVTIGALMDIARGFPIIHLNYIGYDEQAHRRKPSSRNAHWVLKGIDRSIERIYKAAVRSGKRHYDLWVYSDHGQEETIPYVTFYKQPVEEAVAKVYRRMFENICSTPEDRSRILLTRYRGIQGHRAKYISRFFERIFPLNHHDLPDAHPELVVTAMGPLGGVYILKKINKNEIMGFARELVREAKIPLVLMPQEHGKARAFTQDGEFTLPEEAPRVIDPAHPFYDEVVKDLISLCHHPNAGTLTISGWRKNGKAFSFPFENGAHAGPGNMETSAFALIPAHIKTPQLQQDFLRPLDLRWMAFAFLRKEQELFSKRTKSEKHIRLMTYNVHSCIGTDGRVSPQRIARVIARYEPDIVALQELDMGRKKTGEMDQPHLIAQELQMHYHFHPAMQVEEEQYGNAVLSRFPLEMVRAGRLPGINEFKLEPRGALWVTLNIDGVRLQIINTHLAFYIPESKIQARHLMSAQWLLDPRCAKPAILCGDLNNMPYSQAWRAINNYLDDAQLAVDGHRPVPTWSAQWPIGRIDHIFVSEGVKVLKVEAPSTQLNKLASDHLPLIADVVIELQ